MPNYKFQLNGKPVSADSWDPAQPLLYVLRNDLGQHGPKFGCGLGQCGDSARADRTRGPAHGHAASVVGAA